MDQEACDGQGACSLGSWSHGVELPMGTDCSRNYNSQSPFEKLQLLTKSLCNHHPSFPRAFGCPHGLTPLSPTPSLFWALKTMWESVDYKSWQPL